VTASLFLVWALGAMAYAAWRVQAMGWSARRFAAVFEMKGVRPKRARGIARVLVVVLLLAFAAAWPLMWPLGLIFVHPLSDDPS
jgi:hypothetical protein